MSNFAKTKQALIDWDQKKQSLCDKIMASNTEVDFRTAWEAEAREIDTVQQAFADDTADFNQRKNAILIHPDDPWLRRVVAGSETDVEKTNDPKSDEEPSK